MKQSEFYTQFDELVEANKLDEAHVLLEAHTKVTSADERSAPFSVELQFNDTIKADVGGTGPEAAIAIPALNSLSRRLRNARYRAKIGSPGFSGIRIVEEGDSYNQYPIILRDIIDNIAEKDEFAVYSLAAAGDTIEGMGRESEHVSAIQEEQPEAFLISAGGNDFLGGGQLARVLNRYRRGSSIKDVIDERALALILTEIIDHYRSVVNSALQAKPDLRVFGHGYDYAKPREDGKWLGQPLKAAQVPESMWDDVIRYLVDCFNEKLSDLAGEFGGRFTYLDVRENVGNSTNSWYDELHPKDTGFRKIAKPFLDALKNLNHSDQTSAESSVSAAELGFNPTSSGAESGTGIIILDPGHGGNPPPSKLGGSSWNNAIGPAGTLEKTLTLDVAKRTQKVLQDRGHEVGLTRNSDVNKSLANRAEIAKAANASVFVSIHFNASTGHNAQGTETFVHNNHSGLSVGLCLSVQARMVAALGLQDRNASHLDGIKKASFGVLKRNRHAQKTACVLHEISFLDRVAEEQRLSSVSYRIKIAEALADGIEDYLSSGVEMSIASIDLDEIGDAIELGAVDSGLTTHSFLGAAEATPSPARVPQIASAQMHVRGHAIVDERDVIDNEASGKSESVVDSILASFMVVDSLNNLPFENRENDVNEFASVPIGDVIDFSALGQDPVTDRIKLESVFGGVENSGFSFPRFQAHIGALNLRYFEASEFLVMGGSNASGPCAGKNSYPPESKWDNIVRSALMLDEIRHRLGAPIRILSCYRSPSYNACIGGAQSSKHMDFNAIDWRCDTGSVANWHAVAKEVRSSSNRYSGGIGRYNSSRFIHIDTRSYNADW